MIVSWANFIVPVSLLLVYLQRGSWGLRRGARGGWGGRISRSVTEFASGVPQMERKPFGDGEPKLLKRVLTWGWRSVGVAEETARRSVGSPTAVGGVDDTQRARELRNQLEHRCCMWPPGREWSHGTAGAAVEQEVVHP